MAETVKKSRIVSDGDDDGNLEEALMEEFNMRLKSCMSQDDLAVRNEDEGHYEDVCYDFLKAERQHHYEEPTFLLNGVSVKENGHHIDGDYVDMTTVESHDDLSSSSQSVKNRMMLSTDTDACLLFTQTVTSPMLTPSEETVDFFQGFKNQTEINATEENVYENTEFLSKNHEVIYENLKDPPPPAQEENIYENLRESNDQVIYENLKDVTDGVESDVDSEPPSAVADDAICHQMSSSLMKNFEENITTVRNFENIEKDTESVPAMIVKQLKSQFLEGGTGVTVKKHVTDDVSDLKSVDILRQITKFENESTQVVSESYVETTMFESSSGNDGKVSKKKKTKKSRKEEKENLSSVNGCVDDNAAVAINNACYYYNVNVKHLCRSFGDLTKIEDLANNNIVKSVQYPQDVMMNYRMRAKSMSDVFLSLSHINNNKVLIENVFSGVCVKKLKSSFNKFDALQKKNVLHVRSSDASSAPDKFNATQAVDGSSVNCRTCDKAVFQMEQVKAEKSIWHKNCFRCNECNKQLTVDTYQSHEGTLYCKPHFKALFAPIVVEDEGPPKPRKPELIIRENQPAELPPDVVRASDKPDLGLEELQSLNVKERFQVFEHHRSEPSNDEKLLVGGVNVKRSPSILSKLARFQAKGMDVGVSDEALNGVPIEESSSEGEEEAIEEGVECEDGDLIRARKVQKEKPFHFTAMSDVKNRWEQGEQKTSRDERREERKQEIQSIRNRLFMGKQVKMREAYQQAVMVSESCSNLRKEPIEVCDTKTIKERFEKGQVQKEENVAANREGDDDEVYESEISKNSRSLFLQLDANASKAPQLTPSPVPKSLDVRKATEAYLARAASQDVIKSSDDSTDDVQVSTADIQQSFKFFETYKAPEKQKKAFRMTPPREGQIKGPTPEREVYRDPDVVRGDEEYIEDSVIAKETHTATKMLNKFRLMEEDLRRDRAPVGPKPLKRFTPPPEPSRPESNSDESGSEEESEEDVDGSSRKIADEDLLEAQKAARAKQLRAKFERWEANEMKRDENSSAVNLAEEFGGDQSQVESTRSLRARFESMRENGSENKTTRQIRVNRFVEIQCAGEDCDSCHSKVYPLEKITVHGRIYHKNCFKCMECKCVLRMDSYSYNQGLLYCTPHFKRLFISKGNYDTAFGLDQHKEKWNSSATVA